LWYKNLTLASVKILDSKRTDNGAGMLRSLSHWSRQEMLVAQTTVVAMEIISG
jgi:hypothetical protein